MNHLNLDQNILIQKQAVQELSDLIYNKSQTHLHSVLNDWKIQYEAHKQQYLNHYTTINDCVFNDDFRYNFDWLFSENYIQNETFIFKPKSKKDISHRLKQVKGFIVKLQKENPQLVKFSYNYETKNYCPVNHVLRIDDYLDIRVYTFAPLEKYMANWFLRHQKILKAKKAYLTKLLAKAMQEP